MDEPDESIATSLTRLKALEEEHLRLAEAMTEAYGGALYWMDLFAYGALNRSKAQLAGFTQLIRARNLVCAGALLRLQLDTALRFSAAWLVQDPHAFALAVMRGTRVRDLADRTGRKMTDAYLVQCLSRQFDWVSRVYERTSGYVHLSDVHLLSAVTGSEEEGEHRVLRVKISEIDKPLPSSLYVEAIDAFGESTRIFLWYVQGWTATKANPEAVQKPDSDRD
jgi:hypothetical protein